MSLVFRIAEMKRLLVTIQKISTGFLEIMNKTENRMVEIEKNIDKLSCYADYFVLYHKNVKLFESIGSIN